MRSSSVRARCALPRRSSFALSFARPIALVFAVTVAAPERAHAQSASQAQADTLFAEGRDLLEKGRFAEACAKLAKSEELAPGVGTLLNLAYCYEQVGKLRSALDAYAEAETLAIAGSDAKRAAFAKERYAAVEPRAPKLVIRVVPPEVAGLEIRRNGALLAKSDLDHPIAVDPQDYVITASAPDHATWKGAFIVRGEGAVVTVLIPSLSGANSGVFAATATAEPAPSLTLRRYVALGLGAVSAVALGAGVAAAFSAKSRHGDADSHCQGGCDATGAELQSNAVAQGNLATILIAAGLLAGGGGIYLWVVTPEKKAAPRASVGVSPFGAAIGGRF